MNEKEHATKALGPVFIISGAILGFLFWLIYFKTPVDNNADWIGKLPAVNAGLNAISACCLGAGIIAIKRGQKRIHIGLMASATISSALFLICYILYHHYHGDTKFLAEGVIRPIYFFILISHIFLSMAVVPLILLTLWFAVRKFYESHKRIARWTFPIWMYVSVTGVLIYLILNEFNHT